MIHHSDLAEPFVLRDYRGTHYFLNEVLNIYHRMDGPSFEGVNGNQSWHQYGMLHRTGAPARIICDGEGLDGTWWFHYNKLHRIGGPAVELANGDQQWYFYGMKHREDGPAVELDRIGKKEFWLFDRPYNEKEYYEELKQLVPHNKKRIYTNNFISRTAAYTHYQFMSGLDKEDIDWRITEGEVVIGQPALNENEVCNVGDIGRYYITVK